jgi:chromosome segregation ATPase
MTGPRDPRDVAREVVRRAGAPLWRRLRPRIETIAAEHAEHVARSLRGLLDETRAELRHEVGATASRCEAGRADLAHRIDSLRGDLDWHANQIDRIGTHLASLEERLATAEREQVTAPDDPADLVEARRFIDEIRDEHTRVRARLSAVASYEERIGRLEQSERARAAGPAPRDPRG